MRWDELKRGTTLVYRNADDLRAHVALLLTDWGCSSWPGVLCEQRYYQGLGFEAVLLKPHGLLAVENFAYNQLAYADPSARYIVIPPRGRAE